MDIDEVKKKWGKKWENPYANGRFEEISMDMGAEEERNDRRR